MQIIRNLFSRFAIAKELVAFFWKEKMWWLIPIVVMLLVFGILMVFAQNSAVAPFIYTLF